MNKIDNLSNANFQTINIDGIDYPVTITGSGKRNCFILGTGSVTQRTLSKKFKEIFTVYSTDLYWSKKFARNNLSNMTISKIVDDALHAINLLGLEDVILIGHSAFGLIALEAAKRNNPRISSILMIATPTASNPKIAAQAIQHFEENASDARKANDKARKEHYQKIKQPEDSEVSFEPYVAASARYWGNFNISHEFLQELWSRLEVDAKIMNLFFGKLLPEYDFLQNLDIIKVPVAMAGGWHDYDCIPLILWPKAPRPKNFQILDCGNTGHWPQIENHQLFDAQIEKWLSIKNLH